jgi:uncharacterized protein YndB with AHSA1/START domain
MNWGNSSQNKFMATPTEAAEEYLGREFIITREFDAPRELVFQACTDPNHLAQWWGPKGFTNPVCEWDARPGGKIYVVMRAPNGTDYPMGGEIREVVPPERLVSVTGALDEAGALRFEILHTLTLAESEGRTKLTMHSRVIRVTPGADRYLGGFETGMTLSLERLGAHLARQTEPLVVERTFAAPVSLVWRALTTSEDLSRWSFEIKEFRPEVGCEFTFDAEKDGVKYEHLCRVTDVIPEKRLAYSWRYAGHAGDSLVTLDLLAEGEKTRVRLTHTGLESFGPAPDFSRANFTEGWTTLIGTCLKDFVEHGEAGRDLVLAREFDAPRELVWRALTEPEHVGHWWGPRGFTSTIEKMDLRPGGEWRHIMHGPDGVDYPNHSVFLEVTPPERLVYAHGGRREGGPEADFVATWTLDAVAPGKTKVTIRMVFPTVFARDQVVREYGAIAGGRQTLERLGEHLPAMQTAEGKA